MQASIDRLSGELSARYLLYVETLLVDLSTNPQALEFRCGFALRSDHVLRTLTIKVPAAARMSDDDLEVVTAAIFKQLESLIDEAIAASGIKGN